jgi:hypothetical protein
VTDVRKYSDSLFIYGDNNIGKGKGGQAIIRDEPNTLGIPTKKYPSNHPNSFYVDADYNDNIKRIDDAINRIINASKKYKYVILPADGFGTGLAKLPIKAPKTYQYLTHSVENMCEQI